jgi:hypothetical protein
MTNVAASAEASISGRVIDDTGPVAGAHVRVRATENMVLSGEAGDFTLGAVDAGMEVEVTAWADGYYVTAAHITPPAEEVVLTLRPYHTVDHPSYAWADPLVGEGACGNCHPAIIAEWSSNGHASAIDNPRFFSLYNGTDISGETTIGPGFLIDFPGTAGNCASCHAPGAAVDAPLTTNMNGVRGEVTAGIHCDFCHKIGGVDLDEETGSVYADRPGVQSLHMLRPPAGDDIFFGPFDDVHDPDTYLPLISESAYCAACHQASFYGTPIYESYSEWLESPYASIGETCQDCHMPPAGNSYFALPEVGGVARPADSIPSHMQLAAGRDELGEYAELNMVMAQRGRRLLVEVYVMNQIVGHHYPTDYPGRQLLLTVKAVDDAGRRLPLQNGSRIPAWGGEQAGLPGKGFAKILADAETGEAPVVSYWKPTVIVSDNRIPAFAYDHSSYAFLLPEGSGEVEVSAELLYRFQFARLSAAKDWGVPDEQAAEISKRLSFSPQWEVFLPILKDS